MPEPHAYVAHARRPRRATAREAEALAYLAASDSPVIAEDLGRDLAYGGEPRCAHACCKRGKTIVYALASLDLVTMPSSSRFALTERGRIAAALVMAKHPGLREAFFDE